MRSAILILISIFYLFFSPAANAEKPQTDDLTSIHDTGFLICNDFQMDIACFLPVNTARLDLQNQPDQIQIQPWTEPQTQHENPPEQHNHNMQHNMEMPGMHMEGHLAHPFFTHMGVPEGVGEFSLRLSGLITNKNAESAEETALTAQEEANDEEITQGDFAFHLETGLTNWLGFHVRNDRVRDEEHTEAMFQFAAFRSKDGMSGFSPETTIEIPTHSGDKTWRVTVGFTGTLSSKKVAFNEYVDYNPKDKEVENNSALVVLVGKRFYPSFEYLVEKESGEPALGSIVAGIKVHVTDLVTVGFAYLHAVTDERELNWQAIGQSELHWMR